MAKEITPAVAEFLKQPITAAIVTLNPDGSPQLTYVWYEFDGQKFHVSTTDDRVKGRNLERDPRIALSMLDPQNPYRFVSMRGKATITHEGASDLIVRLAVRYQGPEGEAYGRTMQSPSRIIVTLDPETVYANGF